MHALLSSTLRIIQLPGTQQEPYLWALFAYFEIKRYNRCSTMQVSINTQKNGKKNKP
jgi:hypothetical protein